MEIKTWAREGSSQSREYSIIYRRQTFFLSYDLAHPHHLPTSSISTLYLFLSLAVCRRLSILTRGEEEGGGGAKSYKGENASSSCNTL